MRDLLPPDTLPATMAPFEDANFKLVVMGALMKAGVLDFGNFPAFLKAVEGPDYDYEEHGYELSQKAYDYLTHYPLTPEQLSQVRTLTFDGGNDIYRYIFPFWGGEGEEFSIAALTDLHLVPNVTGLCIISMLRGTGLGPLSHISEVETVTLGLTGRWMDFEVLETLQHLSSLSVFRDDLPLTETEKPGFLGRLMGKKPVELPNPVIAALEKRGVRVVIY